MSASYSWAACWCFIRRRYLLQYRLSTSQYQYIIYIADISTRCRQYAQAVCIVVTPKFFPGSRWSKHVICSCWVEQLNNANNSHITYATNTKLAKSTVLDDSAITLEARSCKPSVAKVASTLHTLLWSPQLCSLWVYDWLPDCHMSLWCQ